MRGVGTYRGCARERGAAPVAFVRRVMKRGKKNSPRRFSAPRLLPSCDSINLASLKARPFAAHGQTVSPRSKEDDVRARLSVRRGFGDARGARAGRSVTRADAGRRTRRTVTSPMSLAASVRAPPASSIRANRASLARSSSPLDGAIRLTERSTALFILLRHAQAAAARVAPRNGLSSRRRVATGTVALRAQPRSRTVARSAPYTPLKINAVRHEAS